MLHRSARVRRAGRGSAAFLALALLAAGCGDDDEETTPSEATDQTTATSAAGQDSLEGLEPGEPLKIGVILTFTGPVGLAGEQQFRGLEMAVEDINGDGGIAGHPIELVRRDDGGDPAQAVAATRELVEREGVEIIFGPTLSSPALAMAEFATAEGVTMLTSASATELDNPDELPYVFSGSPNALTQVEAMVRFGQETLDGSKPGILVEATAYGDSLIPAFESAFADAGVAESDYVVERYEQGAPDLTPNVNRLRDAGITVLYHGGIGADNVRIPRTVLSEVGFDIPVVGNQSTQTNITSIVEQIGEEAAENVYAIYFRNQTFAEGEEPPSDVAEFHQRVVEAAGAEAASVSQEATFYDFAFVLKSALEEAGTTEADALREALENVTHEGLLIDWAFGADRHAGPTPETMAMTRAIDHQDGSWLRID